MAIPNFATACECDELKARAEALVEGFDPETISVFSTTSQEKTTNQYFLDSAGNISFFFEEGAFNADGTLVHAKARSINKCGHALHDLDPAFRAFSRSDRMASVFQSLGFSRPLPVQSMYIFKQPQIGGPVVPHQDRCALPPCSGSCLFFLGILSAVEFG